MVNRATSGVPECPYSASMRTGPEDLRIVDARHDTYDNCDPEQERGPRHDPTDERPRFGVVVKVDRGKVGRI